MDTYIDQFRAAMMAAGLRAPDRIQADGELHRFATSERRNDDAGWYVLYGDGVPAGAFGCFRRDLSQPWRADVEHDISPDEQAALQDRMEAVRRKREAATEIARAAAARQADDIWLRAAPAEADYPYLKKKQIAAHGLRVASRSLLVPVAEGGRLHSLQFISADGTKRFLKGGRMQGCCHVLGSPSDVICVAEGFATGASIHEATGFAVAVAFSAGNLLPVAQALRAKHPSARLVICADDDAHTHGNPGITKAREVAAQFQAALAVPEFGSDRPAGSTDFNDLHRHRGLDAVRDCVLAALAVDSVGAATATLATSATDWPTPKPLDRGTDVVDPFPLDALPGEVGAAVREYQAYGGQPPSLVASSALAAVSLAAQGLADVARDERLRGPISLNFLVIAQSGERKTAADRSLASVLGQWERERADSMREEVKRNRAALEVWNAEQEGLKTAIKSAVRSKPTEAEKLQRQFVEHSLTKPTEVVVPRLRYEDVNAQSLASVLAVGYPTAALWSDEAGMVTGSHGMGKDTLLGFLSVLNRLWDGGAIHQDRKQAQSVHLEGRRLTVSLMLQPAVLRELAGRGGGLTRGSGFLARYLVTEPASTMGTRLYQVPPQGMPALARFHRRIRNLLDSPLPMDAEGRLDPPLLSLSVGAFSLWRQYHDAVECELRPHGEYATICDFAAKSAENAVRIAGCLHVFAGAQGAIAEDTMRRAITLARWYLREALRVLEVLDEPQAWTDARLLDSWLAKVGPYSPRDILHAGPNPLRTKARRDAAIDLLVDLGRVRREQGRGREVLVRNPALQPSATAIVATNATDRPAAQPYVAEVAAVAVASDQSTMLTPELVHRLEAMATRCQYNDEERAELMSMAALDPDRWLRAAIIDEKRFAAKGA